MKIRTAACLLLVVVWTAGCSYGEGGEATPEPTPQTSGAAAVADPDWRAVIDDWYDNGALDESHSCAAVRAAIERVPRSSPEPHTAFEDLRRYEARGCER